MLHVCAKGSAVLKPVLLEGYSHMSFQTKQKEIFGIHHTEKQNELLLKYSQERL